MINVTLVNHASVIIEANGHRILTDPWFSGTCFNESWALVAETAPVDYDTIDYLWISHEHPDHFHIPTLKALPSAFKERVTVLFQRSSDHHKMVKALSGMGFKTIRLLPHKRWVQMGSIEVMCYQSRQIDSALAVRSGGQVALNLNDCDFSPTDLRTLRSIVGEPDIMMGQFSIAGFDGVEDAVPRVAAGVIDDLVDAHRILGAKATIPFASYSRFCCADNQFLNRYANRPAAVAKRFAEEGLTLYVLAPGETVAAGAVRDNAAALRFWDEAHDRVAALNIENSPRVEAAELIEAFAKMAKRLRDQHGLAVNALRPIVVQCEDKRYVLDFAKAVMAETEAPAHLVIASQPLVFMLRNPFGLQTLGVSGRYHLLSGGDRWIRLRIAMGLLNADLGLSLRKALRWSQLKYFWDRKGDIFAQSLFTLRRAMAGMTESRPN